MASKKPKPTPRYCIQHSRSTKQDGWRLDDLSLSLKGNVAVTSWNKNTHRTYIDVYTTNVEHSDSGDKPKIIYSKEFEKYDNFSERLVSFIEDIVLVSCLKDKLEVFQIDKDEVLRSRNVTGSASCLSVREKKEIFIGFDKSNKISVYDVTDLNEIKSIILQGIQDSFWPYDMMAEADRIILCLRYRPSWNECYERSVIFEEKSGNIFSELIKPTDISRRTIKGITVNIPLSVVVIAVFDFIAEGQQLIFYSLLSENNCGFLIVEVDFGVDRIRISDRGNMMITGNAWTSEVKVYDMNEFCSYSRLKQSLMSKLQKDDCVKLIKYFEMPIYKSDVILKSATLAEDLLLTLEETGVLQPANVDRLMAAFNELKVDSSFLCLVDFYKKTRMQVTSYDRFLAALSAHLRAFLPGDLCEYFNISDQRKKSIVSSQNPGLALLLALDEMGFITAYKVESLERAFTEMQLIQPVAKIHEYQSIVEEEGNLLQEKDITEEGKKLLFIKGLQNRIKSWYETMTPVPWKTSCLWRCTDLFIGTSLIWKDQEAKGTFTPADADTKFADIKVLYTELFSHEKLKSEKQILLQGDPGSGKTLLLSQLAYDWCQGKFNDIEVLILLPLKFVKQKTIVQTIKELYFPGDERLSISDIEYLLLNRETSKCLLLDGLEEYNGKLTKEEEVKVVTVMSQVKFPSCKVVVSSRAGYAKHLPYIVGLKLANFSNIEMNAYIQKVFPDTPEKQREVTKVIKENTFLLDLCSTPLFFVFVVHNIESMENLDIAQVSKVTPFMKNMVYTLYSLGKVISQKKEFDRSYKKQDEVVLEELAYNGLCRKYQQLSWPKEVVESKVNSIREWIDAGVLVVEENILATMPLMMRGHHLPRTRADDVTVTKEKEDSESLVPGATAEPQPDVDSGVKSTAEPDSRKVQVITTESSSTTARYVPLQVKFAHKIIQEWFAAKHLSSMISRLKNAEYTQKHLTEKLLFVNSSDLRFFLWFTVALFPPCCPYILKHLLSSNRTDEGNLPKHIMDYIFLCFSECDGKQVHGIHAAVTDVCKEEITVHPDDSRLVQQAKVAMLELASKCGITCRKLILANVVNSTTKDTLHFTSGVSVNVLDTLEVLEVSDCNRNLTEKDCANVLEFIKTCDWLQHACLKISKQPPRVEEHIIDQFRESGKTIIWIMGPNQRQRLNTVTGEWMIEDGKTPVVSETARNRHFGWGMKTILEAEETISKEGGPLEISDTGFKIDIPPDALQEGVEECNIGMKIVPPDVFDETDTEYTSNSSATVELLPNNLTFKEPFKLTLPHCLQLKKGAEYKAKIFVSHHEEGMYPCWEEKTEASYELTETTCKIWLSSFCWVKYVIDGKTVEAQRVQVFVAGKYMSSSSDTIYETEAGFFPDTAGAGEIFRSHKTLHGATKKTFLLYREGKQPLKFLIKKIIPSAWRYLPDEKKPKEIPFESIDQFKKSSCQFIFVNQSEEPLIPRFIFSAVQGERSIRLSYRPEVQDQVGVSTQTD